MNTLRKRENLLCILPSQFENMKQKKNEDFKQRLKYTHLKNIAIGNCLLQKYVTMNTPRDLFRIIYD